MRSGCLCYVDVEYGKEYFTKHSKHGDMPKMSISLQKATSCKSTVVFSA